MKRFGFLLCFFAAVASQAQSQPAQPAQPAQPTAPQTRPQQPTRPQNPPAAVPPISGIATQAGPNATSTNPFAAQSNRFGIFTNQLAGTGPGGALTVSDVEGLIVNLQSSIEQTLPVLMGLANAQGRLGVNPQTQGPFIGTVGNNQVGMNAETLQLLTVLQFELQQRVLSVLNRLNGLPVTGGGVAAVVPGTFTGRFVVVTNANQRILMPTGR